MLIRPLERSLRHGYVLTLLETQACLCVCTTAGHTSWHPLNWHTKIQLNTCHSKHVKTSRGIHTWKIWKKKIILKNTHAWLKLVPQGCFVSLLNCTSTSIVHLVIGELATWRRDKDRKSGPLIRQGVVHFYLNTDDIASKPQQSHPAAMFEVMDRYGSQAAL